VTSSGRRSSPSVPLEALSLLGGVLLVLLLTWGGCVDLFWSQGTHGGAAVRITTQTTGPIVRYLPVGTHDLAIDLEDAVIELKGVEVLEDLAIEADIHPLAISRLEGRPVVTALDIEVSGIEHHSFVAGFRYRDEDLASLGIREDTLAVYHYVAGRWVREPSTVDTIGNIVTCTVASLSPFALVGGDVSGPATSLFLVGNYDSKVRPNQSLVITGAVYYNNNTLSPTPVTVTLTLNGTSVVDQTDTYGNFRFNLTAPLQEGTYTINITANTSTLQNSTTMSLNVTTFPLFRVRASLTSWNDDATNTTVGYPFPVHGVPDLAVVRLQGDLSLAGSKTYRPFQYRVLGPGGNTSGNFTFGVGSLSSSSITVTDARLYISSTHQSGYGTNQYLDAALDGTDLDEGPGPSQEAHEFVRTDNSTWDWSYNVTSQIVPGSEQEVFLNVTTSTSLYINASSEVVINYTAAPALVAENLTLTFDQVVLFSQSGSLSSGLINITGYLHNGTNYLNFTSPSAGGFNYSMATDFHLTGETSSTRDGHNYSVSFQVANPGSALWLSPAVYFHIPAGGHDILVTDRDLSQNITDNCTIPGDGGDVIIPAGVVGNLSAGSQRNFEINYTLAMLEAGMSLDKGRYAPGEAVNLTINVTYRGSPSNASVVVNLSSPDGSNLLENAVPFQTGTGVYLINYTLPANALPGALSLIPL